MFIDFVSAFFSFTVNYGDQTLRDLSFNELYGDIPFSISKLKQLEFL